jgi:hypothetical protein
MSSKNSISVSLHLKTGTHIMSPQNVQERPTPPFPEQQQQVPGLESQMNPRPDYGEQSYRGSGKLQGKAAIITGGDSGIGRAVALAFAREGADILIARTDLLLLLLLANCVIHG